MIALKICLKVSETLNVVSCFWKYFKSLHQSCQVPNVFPIFSLSLYQFIINTTFQRSQPLTMIKFCPCAQGHSQSVESGIFYPWWFDPKIAFLLSLHLCLIMNCKCSQTSLSIYSQTGSILFLAHINFCLSSNCEHAIPITYNLSIFVYKNFIHCPIVISQKVLLSYQMEALYVAMAFTCLYIQLYF